MTQPFYNRPTLASKFAERITSEKGASGTFIAALRRTGKSTFIREDLIPVLEKSGATVIYVDLWANKLADPGELISAAIRDQLRKQEGVVAQFARKAGLEKVTIGGLQLNLDKVGSATGDTLSKALVALSQETKGQIVMVIDEAQHAQTTENGAAAMYALKAARDELNSTKNHGFRLVATGSNRDKLAILVQGKEQAFLNAKLIDLPHLGDDYLHWKLDSFLGDAKPSFEALKKAFEHCTHRPEVLSSVLDDMELLEGLTADNVDKTLDDIVQTNIRTAKRSFDMAFNSLDPLQAALMKIMAEQRSQFAPYTETTYSLCRTFCRERTKEDVKIDSSSVGYALDLLRKDSLIWKSGRGVYSIEDTQHIAWLSGIPEESLDSPAGQFNLKPPQEPSNIDPAIPHAKPGQRYDGKILFAESTGQVVQDHGRGKLVVHQVGDLNSTPAVGTSVSIVYDASGRGSVKLGKTKEHGQSR